jgi:NAD(P)-dependent dehydrogenase (short-subunit alcohol dehydrogenase family)
MANSYFDLTGRSALVTGAAGGIGSAVAAALADAGAAVLVTDLEKDAAAAVAERISVAGGRAESAALTSRTATPPTQRPRRRPHWRTARCTS